MNTLKPSEFANRIGVCLKTVQSWDNRGILPARRTPTNRRYYTEEDVENYFKGGAENENERPVLESHRDS